MESISSFFSPRRWNKRKKPADSTDDSDSFTESDDTRKNFSETSSTSESPSTTELEELHTQILNSIECPICLEAIIPPFHQCRNGHLVCNDCRSKITLCPICKENGWVTPAVLCAQISNLAMHPCRNTEHGCTVTTRLAGKNEHESTCPFRHYTCVFSACQWTGLKHDMLTHLRSITHSSQFLEGASHQIDVELSSPTTNWAIYCFGRIFSFNVFQMPPNSMYASAYLLGDGRTVSAAGYGNTESDFTCTVTVNGPSSARSSCSWQTPVVETMRTNQLHPPEQCFCIPDDKLKYFVRCGGFLRLHVNLDRLGDDSSSSSMN